MDKIFLIIALLAVVGVVASLLMGLAVLGKGTPKAHQLSQKMMQARIACQAIAIVALFLAYLAKH
jgi:hypothetical protein